METFTKSMVSREWRSSPTTCLWRDKRRRGWKEKEFWKCKTFSPLSEFFFLQIQQKEWSNSFRRGQQYTRVSVVRPAERGQHQGCPACPLCKRMEARQGQVLLGVPLPVPWLFDGQKGWTDNIVVSFGHHNGTLEVTLEETLQARTAQETHHLGKMFGCKRRAY